MMPYGSLGNIFGIVGHVFSIAIFLLPLPTIKTICKKKTVEQNLPILYLATLMNCMLWFLYGMPFVQPNRVLVLTINDIGIFIEAVYIIIFFVFASRSQRVKIIGISMAELLFVGIMLAAVLGGAHTHDKRTKIVGPLCAFFGTVMYAPVISEMIPNIVGMFVNLVQANIFGYYQSNSPQDEPQQNLELPEVTPSNAPDTLSSVQVEK